MEPFDVFGQQLHEALAHLHDPDYQPPEAVRHVAGRGPASWQTVILQAIEALLPSADVPPTSPARRHYEILYHRFTLGLTQEEAAERLHMSVRTLGRAQRQAIHALARHLWERRPVEGGAQPGADPSDWRAQIRENLAALRARAPELVSNVGETLTAALERLRALVEQEGKSLRLGSVPPGLLARVHPSVLRQVLIMAASQLLRTTAPGAIEISAGLEGGQVLIHLQGPPARAPEMPDAAFLREILAFDHGSLDVTLAADHTALHIAVPVAGEVNVLVIDDNLDSVHYYRRCTERTRFQIRHVQLGQAALEAIHAQKPDVIVLDIVLPDTDGWDLLERLRREPATQSIPVIVCSIVREESLASALGAVRYLPKPIRDWEFLQALEAVIK